MNTLELLPLDLSTRKQNLTGSFFAKQIFFQVKIKFESLKSRKKS